MVIREFRQLTRNIAIASARNQEQQREILRDLQDVWGLQLDRGSTAEVDSYFEFAIELVRYLADGRTPGPEEILTMVTRFLARAECTLTRSINPGDAGQDVVLKMAELMHTSDLRLAEEPIAPRELNLVGHAAPEEEQAGLNVAMGEFLIHLGIVGASQIAQAMEEKLPGERIGQTCVRLGFATPDQVEEAAQLQMQLRKHGQNREVLPSVLERGSAIVEWRQSLLGEILVGMRAVTRAQLQQALDSQRACGLLLGEVLVQAGACDWDTIRNAIRIQEEMRKRADDPWRVGRNTKPT